MRAARLIAHGRPALVQELDLPTPGPGEVLVELSFGGVNPVDRYVVAGDMAPDGPLPRTLGSEASGHLEGKPVLVAGFGLGATRDGVWATAAVVPREAVFEAPENSDLSSLSAMGVAGLTAWNVVEMAQVVPQDRVLVLGASGGVGLPLLSLATSRGATVWGQTGSVHKAQAIREQGAAEAVVTDAPGLAGALADFAPTVVFDPLGNGFTESALACMAPYGRLVVFGTSAGLEARLQLRPLYRSGQRILGYAGLRLTQAQRREGLGGALQAFADGRLRLRVGRTLRLDEVNQAFPLLTNREVVGKVVLELR